MNKKGRVNEIKLENKQVRTSLDHQRPDDCRDCVRRTACERRCGTRRRARTRRLRSTSCARTLTSTSLSRAKFEGLCIDRFKMITPVEHVFCARRLTKVRSATLSLLWFDADTEDCPAPEGLHQRECAEQVDQPRRGCCVRCCCPGGHPCWGLRREDGQRLSA